MDEVLLSENGRGNRRAEEKRPIERSGRNTHTAVVHARSRTANQPTGAATRDAEEEQIAWDEDSDDETTQSTPNPSTSTSDKTSATGQAATITAIAKPSPAEPNIPAKSSAASDPKPTESLRLLESRRSNEISQPDSDASYDLLSGANTGAPGSPKDDKDKEKVKEVKKQDVVAEESDEEDWE